MFKLNDFQVYKQTHKKITMVTAYDYFSAKIVAESGIDTILVGDSLGMVFAGNNDTLSVTIDNMIYHANAVKKGAPDSFIIVDMPFLSYHTKETKTIKNAGKIIKATNCNAVKVEINSIATLSHVKALIDAQIPVIGHLGLTPQSVNIFGGFKIQGKTNMEANKIIDLAAKLNEIGVSAIVLECIPDELAKAITTQINIPTIGIGAGNACDGQVLVFYDLLGFEPDKKLKFVKEYANAYQYLTTALKNYKNEVNQAKFPLSMNLH
jgi:3-methyl-2-oxobutanoate hydroxymethyltransferase